VAWVVVPLLILCVTNPANQKAWKAAVSLEKKKPSRWLTPRITNYGIFSMEEKIEGIIISGLQQSRLCPFKSKSIGDICEYLGEFI
jgi:hypothetical protein